jgi:SAM-dependent methyltransferase
VFVHSVFSHFSEAMHLRWLEELRRTVRPGGAVAISVRPRNFIEALREMRDWSVNGESLVDTDRWRARYDAGEFCFSRYGPRSDPWWGEAVIPKTYIEREWSRFFEVVEFVEGTSPLKLEEPGRAPHPAAEQSFVLLKA